MAWQDTGYLLEKRPWWEPAVGHHVAIWSTRAVASPPSLASIPWVMSFRFWMDQYLDPRRLSDKP